MRFFGITPFRALFSIKKAALFKYSRGPFFSLRKRSAIPPSEWVYDGGLNGCFAGHEAKWCRGSRLRFEYGSRGFETHVFAFCYRTANVSLRQLRSFLGMGGLTARDSTFHNSEWVCCRLNGRRRD